MMEKMRKLVFAMVAFLCLCACRNGQGEQTANVGDTLKLKYAEHLEIVKHDGYTAVKLADPWNLGKTLHTYLLVAKGEELPAEARRQAQGAVSVVRIPLERTVVATSVHCGLMQSMNCQQAIAGVCDVQYINLPFVQQGVKGGKIADCGSGLQPTLESIIDLQPDAIFLSPFQNSGGYGRIEELDVPIIETADYMETSALGRAEWVRFYGMLFGAEHEADSIFAQVERNYMELRQKAHESTTRPTLLMDKLTGPVWYVPAGQSTVGKVIADANIAYPWADDTHSGSLPLPFETILEKAAQADIWLFRYNNKGTFRREHLLQDNSGYSQFKAYQQGNLFGCSTETSTFYEETPFHPDLLLRDFICIAHPDLQLGSPKYFLKIE